MRKLLTGLAVLLSFLSFGQTSMQSDVLKANKFIVLPAYVDTPSVGQAGAMIRLFSNKVYVRNTSNTKWIDIGDGNSVVTFQSNGIVESDPITGKALRYLREPVYDDSTLTDVRKVTALSGLDGYTNLTLAQVMVGVTDFVVLGNSVANNTGASAYNNGGSSLLRDDLQMGMDGKLEPGAMVAFGAPGLMGLTYTAGNEGQINGGPIGNQTYVWNNFTCEGDYNYDYIDFGFGNSPNNDTLRCYRNDTLYRTIYITSGVPFNTYDPAIKTGANGRLCHFKFVFGQGTCTVRTFQRYNDHSNYQGTYINYSNYAYDGSVVEEYSYDVDELYSQTGKWNGTNKVFLLLFKLNDVNQYNAYDSNNVSNPGRAYYKFLKRTADGLKRHGAKVIIGSLPRPHNYLYRTNTYEPMTVYEEVEKLVAAQDTLSYLPFYNTDFAPLGLMSGSTDTATLYGQVHPNDAGHAVLKMMEKHELITVLQPQLLPGAVGGGGSLSITNTTGSPQPVYVGIDGVPYANPSAGGIADSVLNGGVSIANPHGATYPLSITPNGYMGEKIRLYNYGAGSVVGIGQIGLDTKFYTPSGSALAFTFGRGDNAANSSMDIVFRYGNIGVRNYDPQYPLDIYGINGMRYKTGQEANGKVLTSDADGVASWQTITAPASTLQQIFDATPSTSGVISNDRYMILGGNSYIVSPQVSAGRFIFNGDALILNKNGALNIPFLSRNISGSEALVDFNNVGTVNGDTLITYRKNVRADLTANDNFTIPNTKAVKDAIAASSAIRADEEFTAVGGEEGFELAHAPKGDFSVFKTAGGVLTKVAKSALGINGLFVTFSFSPVAGEVYSIQYIY